MKDLPCDFRIEDAGFRLFVHAKVNICSAFSSHNLPGVLPWWQVWDVAHTEFPTQSKAMLHEDKALPLTHHFP